MNVACGFRRWIVVTLLAMAGLATGERLLGEESGAAPEQPTLRWTPHRSAAMPQAPTAPTAPEAGEPAEERTSMSQPAPTIEPADESAAAPRTAPAVATRPEATTMRDSSSRTCG